MSLSNQKCMTQTTFINLHPNEYRQELHYYPFAVKLDRCVESCNTLNDLITGINGYMISMITGLNESKALA